VIEEGKKELIDKSKMSYKNQMGAEYFYQDKRYFDFLR